MLKSGTQIRPSPKNLNVSTIMVQMATVSKTISLTLADTEVWEKVSVNVKVVEVKEVFQLHDRVKQDVIVADQTGAVRVCLWEDHVHCMEKKKCYSLKNFVVREFQSTKYLSMPKEGTEIVEIDDIGDVAKDFGSSEEEILVLQNVTVVGVPYLGSYKACLSCKARVEPQTPPLGKCSKVDCQMMQRYDLCAEQTTAKLMLMYEAEGQNKIVHSHAYGNVVKEIAGCAEDVSAELLLRAAKSKSVTLIKDKSILKDVKHD